jgi:cyanophycin synthetase
MVKTIQGLNLESPTTTVKIQLKGNNIGEITQLLDKIASFHPIFITEYTISPEELVVRSKLPSIWRESANTLNSFSNSEIAYADAEQYVVDTVIEKRIKSMSTIPILYAAHSKNIETTPLILDELMLKGFKEGYRSVMNRYYLIGCGKGSQSTGSISSSKDAYVAQNIQRDKWSTNTMIERLNLPLPKWQAVDSISELKEVWDKYQKPVVIKPTGLVGGHGVVVGINTLEEAKEAYKFGQDAAEGKAHWQKKIMIQEQIKGEDYRLLVVDGKLEIATKRIPAFVTGDGNSTIEELIEETNKDPRRDLKNPAHILKPIIIDEPLRKYLKEQGFSLESIPEKKLRIPVRKVASMSQGGITEDFTDKVSKEIRTIVESIAQSIHAFVLGVDVMCLDLSKPLTKENGGILEINTMPESYLNLFPVLGTQRGYVAQTFVEKLLKENHTQKIVVVGQTTQHIPTLLRKTLFGEKDLTIGELIGNTYFINGLRMNEDTLRWKATEAVKCNGSLDVIILHHRDWNDVEENGLGFDSIDTLYITKEHSKVRENMRIVKKYKKMKLINKIKII